MDLTRVSGGNILVAFSFVTLERKLYTIVSLLSYVMLIMINYCWVPGE